MTGFENVLKRLMHIILSLFLTIGLFSLQGMAVSAETEWDVGDTINLNGYWFVPDDEDPDNKYLCLGQSEITTATYISVSNQWNYSVLLPVKDGDGKINLGYINIKLPEGKTSSHIPVGFKIKEGDGTEGNPYRFELMYETIAVTGVSLDPTEKTVMKGESFAITAAVQPAKATDKSMLVE